MNLNQVKTYVSGVLKGWISNKGTLDKLSESEDGNLLFDGQEIKGGSGSNITISEETSNAIQQKDDGIFVEDKTEQINNIQNRLDAIKTSNELISQSETLEDTPVGHIISYMGNNAPKHYLICDGTEYNIADYPYLVQHFIDEFGSTNYFGGDGINTFAVPDLRGEFLRGTGINSHTNQGSGSNVGVHQDGTVLPNIQRSSGNGLDWYRGGEITSYDSINSTTTIAYAIGGHAWTTDNTMSTFTSRPTNTSVLYCIKYEPTYYMSIGQYTVQGFENYSTEEQIIGCWIDGKPIYRKVVTLSTTEVIDNRGTSISHGISYIDCTINCKAISTTTYSASDVFWYNPKNSTSGVFYCAEGLGEVNILIFEYTKTTDAENSFTIDMLDTIILNNNEEEITEEQITEAINIDKTKIQ